MEVGKRGWGLGSGVWRREWDGVKVAEGVEFVRRWLIAACVVSVTWVYLTKAMKPEYTYTNSGQRHWRLDKETGIMDVSLGHGWK